MTKKVLALPLVLLLLALLSPAISQPTSVDYEAMAARIISALKLREGERVLVRFDPGYFNELVAPLRRHIRAAGAVDLGALEYLESAALSRTAPVDEAKQRAQFEAHAQAFEQLLDAVEVYLWLPMRTNARELPGAEARALQRWLDKGGARRQLHFQ